MKSYDEFELRLFCITFSVFICVSMSACKNESGSTAKSIEREVAIERAQTSQREGTSEHRLVLKVDSEFTRISIPNLVQGKKNDFTIAVENRTGEDLQVEELQTSCGCLIAGKFEKSLPFRATRTIPVSLSPGYQAGKFARDITLLDSKLREWHILLDCTVLSPIELNEHKLEFGTAKGIKKFEIQISDAWRSKEEPAVSLDSLKCEPLGAVILAARILNRENLNFLELETDADAIGSRTDFSENVRISNGIYTVEVPVRFKCLPTIQYRPEVISRMRCREGLQRVMITGLDRDVDRVVFRGKNAGGQLFPIQIKDPVETERIRIFFLQIEAAILEDLEFVEIQIEKGSTQSLVGKMLIGS